MQDPAGLQKKIIPLLSEAGIEKDIHDFISMRSWVNFARKDREAVAWKMLFTALGKPDAPIPITEPEKPKPETSSNWHLAHPYPMPPNFTGRETEREMLTKWLTKDSENRLFILRALGGFGKSALSWHWLTHDVSAKDWPKVVWWSFYEGDASFENFIRETLEYLNIEAPQGQRQQMDALFKVMNTQKILLIMDGFERALRAYSSINAPYQEDDEEHEEEVSQRDCVNINAEIFLKNLCVLPNIKGKVLMTTRLTPRAVEQRGELVAGCHEEELQAMQKEDAVAFFRAQGIRGTRAEIESACQPYGYHPLSLRVLAGLIANDREAPGDIKVTGELDITDDVIQNKHHVLEVAYNTLSPEQQKLLSHIACFRSAMTYEALKAISDRDIKDDLATLEHRGLLHWDKTANKYDLHPIVRRYAYERLTVTDRTAAHTRLLDYFEAVPKPEKVEKLEDLAPVIELYHHMVRANQFDEAKQLFKARIDNPTYYQFGAYELQIELLRSLFPDGEDTLPRLKNESDQASILNDLAIVYDLSGQPRRAVTLYEKFISSSEKRNAKTGTAIGLGNVATLQRVIGALMESEHNLHRSIDICLEIADDTNKARSHGYLVSTFSYSGQWDLAEQEFNFALETFEKNSDIQAQGIIWAYRALRYLLMARDHSQSKTHNLKSTIQSATRALDLIDEVSRQKFRYPRDYMRAHWLLGAADRALGDLAQAERHLSEALTYCRAINVVDHEADILLDLARLRYDQKKPEEAKTLAEEALLITERSGYVLQGADVHLFLAQLALEQENDKEKAKELAERAKELATCDGPPYYYKVSYEEAERFLEKLS